MWIKKLLVLIVIVVLLFTLSTAEEVRTFPMNHLSNPDSITVDDQHVYISEGTHIYIYDKENLKLKKKFGKRGEGPQEFLLNVMQGVERLLMDIQGDEMMINSLGKISFFNKNNGSFIRESKIPSQVSEIKSLGDNFTGQVMMFDKAIQYRAINLYDDQLNKIREIFRLKHHFQFSKRELRLGENTTQFLTYQDNLYLAWEDDFIIRVYDRAGNQIRTIRPQYQRVKVSNQYKDRIITYLKTDKKYKDFMVQIQPKVIFPEYFCAIAYMVIADQTLYVFTHREREEKNECLIMDLEGNPKGTVFLTLKQPDDLLPVPFGIKDNQLYQLTERDENWELKITKIKQKS